MKAISLADSKKIIPVVECFLIKGDKVLMFKRSDKAERFPGFWIGPGGKIDRNEDPITAGVREIKEETNIELNPKNLKLKVNCIHHYLEREEVYIVWIFIAKVKSAIHKNSSPNEGTSKWFSLKEVMKLDNVFPASRFYFDHVLNDKPGVLYLCAEVENAGIKKVLSRHIIL